MRESFVVAIAWAVLISASPAAGSPIYDHAIGTWTDNYSDDTGLPTLTGVGVDPADGKLKLTNAAGGFTPPYLTSGEAVTDIIIPVSVTKWGTITASAHAPANTSVTLQVLDETEAVFPDTLLPNNQAGIPLATGPIVIGSIQVEAVANLKNAKFARLRLKLRFATSNVNSTPTIDVLSLSWIPKAGDLSASPLASTSWPIADVDAQGTRHTKATAQPVYQVVRWATPQADFGGTLRRGANGTLFNKTIGTIAGPESQLSEIVGNSGSVLWSRQIWGNPVCDTDQTLAQNGTIYSLDIHHDILLAYDGKAQGALKWTHQFGEGHGNQNVAIGSDGTIYVIKTQLVGTPEHALFAFNADGSTKWVRALVTEPCTPDACDPGASQVVIAPGGTLHFVFQTAKDTASLFFVDPATGHDTVPPVSVGASVRVTPLVDQKGTVYVASDSAERADKKISAILANGTTAWSRVIDHTRKHWKGLSMRSDKVLLAERVSPKSKKGAIEAIDIVTGNVIWQRPLTSDNDLLPSELFSDSSNGFFVRTYVSSASATSLPAGSAVYYFDAANKERWHLGWAAGSGEVLQFHDLIQDQIGAVYGNLLSVAAGVPKNVVFGMAPWLITHCMDTCDVDPGGSLTIKIGTTMPRVDPISGQPNQLQVVLEGGTIVPASYVGEALGSTRWTADVVAPTKSPPGEYHFTIEASAAGIVTDVPVHMSTPPPGSNNTGVVATGRFGVERYPCSAAELCGCRDNADCLSGVCDQDACQPPSCSDTIKNGRESDVDCGGAVHCGCPNSLAHWKYGSWMCKFWYSPRRCTVCKPCGTGKACSTNSDCANKSCAAHACS